MPLNVPETEAERIAGKLVDDVQHGMPSTPEEEESSDEAAAAGDTVSPSKRVMIHHSAEVKDWFLDLVAIQRERLGWNYITTFRHAQFVRPDIFSSMNVSVPKRSKHSDEMSAFGSGSAQKVPYAVYTVLHEILKTVTSKVPVSTSVLQPPVNKELEKLGYGSVTQHWLPEFTLQRDMSFRKHVLRQSLKFSVGEVADLPGNIREKLVHLLDL